VLLVFSANPKTTPRRKNHHAAQRPYRRRNSHPLSAIRRRRHAITQQEAWTRRKLGIQVEVPDYLRQLVEEIAFQARDDKRVDKRSGVSQRLPITVLESMSATPSNVPLVRAKNPSSPAFADLYSALPASPASSNSNTKANSRALKPLPATHPHGRRAVSSLSISAT